MSYFHYSGRHLWKLIKHLSVMCKWNNHRLKCWKLIWYHWHSFLGINFRLQARTRMEKQILLQIAFGIVLKDLFTSKCDQTDNLSKTEQEFSTLARHAVYWKTRHSAIFFWSHKDRKNFRKANAGFFLPSGNLNTGISVLYNGRTKFHIVVNHPRSSISLSFHSHILLGGLLVLFKNNFFLPVLLKHYHWNCGNK